MKRIAFLVLFFIVFSTFQSSGQAAVSEVHEDTEIAVVQETTKISPLNLETYDMVAQDATKQRVLDSSPVPQNPAPEYVDWSSLKNFLKEQSFISGRRKEGKLRFSGDVRTRWVVSKEKFKGNILPDPTLKQIPVNRFRTDFNMLIDYRAEKSWLTSKMQWVALAGTDHVGSGVNIDRAFIGYRPFTFCSNSDFFVELGRSSLGDMFESQIEFNSSFDGVHFYFSSQLPGKKKSKFILHGGPFVVDMAKKHYAWIAEAIVNQLPGGLTVKGNVIDWHSFDSSDATSMAPTPGIYEFLVGQVLLSHQRTVSFGKGRTKPLEITAVALKNFLARATATSMNKKQDLAGYLGLVLGEVRVPKDWLLSVRYEYVQALAIPEDDISGIGHGNALGFFFAEAVEEGYDPGDANGFANYKGVSLSGMYCLAPGLLLKGQADFSIPAVSGLGGAFSYRRGEISLITAF